MKLSKMKKEDLELLSHKDITYYILEEEGKMNTADLFKRVVTLLELPNKTFEEKIGDYYTLLTTDKRFILLEDGTWDLRSRHTSDKIVKVTEDDDEEDDEEENDADLRLAEDRFFQNIAEKKSRLKPSVSVNDEFFARTEAKRCMECSYLCLKCVDVCPNRANIGIDLRETGLFEDPYQVLHIDAYCNECGNCATFCPHSGRPYKDKFTLFSLPEDFDNSDNSGFIADGNLVKIRLDGKIIEGEIGRDGELEADVPEEIKAIIEEIFLSYSYLLSPVEE